jgi:acetoacetyl-CoA synthetase
MPANDQVTVPVSGRNYGALLSRPAEPKVREVRTTSYVGWMRDSGGPNLRGHDEPWQRSVAEPEAFWASLLRHFDELWDLADAGWRADAGARWFEWTALNNFTHDLATAPTNATAHWNGGAFRHI